MDDIVKESQDIVARVNENKELIAELAQLLPDSDAYPKNFEDDKDKIKAIEAWLDKNEQVLSLSFTEIILSSLRCLKALIYLKALRHVSRFRLYKKDVIESNKYLSKQEKKPDVNYFVTCQLQMWGVSVQWRKTYFLWNSKGRKSNIRSNYLSPSKETYSLPSSCFAKSGEHKDMLMYLEESYAQCRKDSALLYQIQKDCNLLSTNTKD